MCECKRVHFKKVKKITVKLGFEVIDEKLQKTTLFSYNAHFFKKHF